MTRRLLTVAVAACATTPARPIPLAVLIDGDRAAVGKVSTIDGLDLHEVTLPAPQPPPSDDTNVAITRARTAFAGGEFSSCREALATVDLVHVLARGDRNLASRALVLGAACAWPDKAGAEATANRLAGFGLDLPDMTVTPEIDRMLGTAITAAGAAPRHSLAVAGVVGAQLSIDGRAGDCALPCTVDVAPGDHVLAVVADGYAPASRLVRSPDVDHVTVAEEPANSELAARQWRTRLGRGLPATDAVGVTLLAKLAGGSRIAYLHGDAAITAALVVDGKLVASTTAGHGDATDAIRELAYDGGVLHRPSVFQRPWFWIATAGAAIVIAGAIVAITYKPDPTTVLSF